VQKSTDALHGLVPWYLNHYILCVADSNRCRIRSSSFSQLMIRRTWLFTVGERAFPVAGSRLWNGLPPDVTSALTLTVFRNRLKTYFFPDYWHSELFSVSSSVHRV